MAWSLNELVKLPSGATYIPGVEEIIDPGQPARAAYCAYETVTVSGPVDCIRLYDDDSGDFVWICYGGGATTETVQVCYDGQAYIPPTVIQEGVDGQFIYDYNFGWNSGAVGNTEIPTYSLFQFQIYGSSQGVAVGIADLYSPNYESYAEMELAIIAQNGAYAIWHNGSVVSGSRTFTSDTIFQFERNDDALTIYAAGEVVYQTTLATTLYRADCSLYSAYDGIFDASITDHSDEATLLAASSGGHLTVDSESSAQMGGYAERHGSMSADTSSSASFATFQINSTVYSALASDTVSDVQMAGVAAPSASISSDTVSSSGMLGRRTHEAYPDFEPLTLFAGEGNRASADLLLEPLELEANANLIEPSYAIIAGQLPGLTCASHCLTGQVVTSTDLELGALTLMASDHAYAEVNATLEPLTLVAFELMELDLSLFGRAPGFSLKATMLEAGTNGLIASAPAFQLSAQTGSQLNKKTPGFTLSASSTIDGYMTLNEVIGYA